MCQRLKLLMDFFSPPRKHFRAQRHRFERGGNSSVSDALCVCRLDVVLYRKCQGDASRLCHTHGWNETSELMPPGAVFSCLYRHAYRTEEQGRRVSAGVQLTAVPSVMCWSQHAARTLKSLLEGFTLGVALGQMCSSLSVPCRAVLLF